MRLRSVASKSIKSFSTIHVNSMVAGVALPSFNCRIDVEGIELNPVAAASRSLGCDECGPGAQEPIQHQVPTSRAVEQGIGNQSDGFHRRVQSQELAFITLFGKGVQAWIFPDVSAIATESPKLDVVSVLFFSVF